VWRQTGEGAWSSYFAQRLAGVAAFAERLQVGDVPHEAGAAVVRDDVVGFGRELACVLFSAAHAEGVIGQKALPHFSPAAAVVDAWLV
jgi:hypothetical protein